MAANVPLPLIMDSTRRMKVFRHKGLPDDNTRQALLGAALLLTISTLYRLAQYPASATGEVTMARSSLVDKKAVASYALIYGLPNHLQAKENVDTVRQTPSAQGTVFEAYVAAVFVESNFDFNLVKGWLFSLWNAMAV